MQHLVFEAIQDPEASHAEFYGGATVVCWIKNQTPKNSVLIARRWIEDSGWIVLELEDQYPVTADDYPAGSDGRPYFEQAEIDEEVFLFVTSPASERE